MFLLLTLAASSPLLSQQTIFNIPSADVLSRGAVYGEVDALGTAHSPREDFFTVRGVFGLGGGVEAGINLGGFNSLGSHDPTVNPSLKWQPVSKNRFAFTTGLICQLPATGGSAAQAAVLGYGHFAFKPRENTRITLGGWTASSHYAAEGPASGGLAGIEQKVGPHLSLAADWYTGGSSIGYFTPGLIWSRGKATFYAGYTLQNHSRQGDGLLLEFGWSF
jgi:hypothetical protein